MRYQTIRCDRTKFQAALTLPSCNSGATIGETVAAELIECCRELGFDDDLRVVTITGDGDAFATDRQKLSDDLLDADLAERMAWFRGMGAANAVAGLPMPVLAILNGDATAHGLEVALAADLRIAANNAHLGAGAPARVGFPFDGMTQRLPRLIGPGLTRDMLLTGRNLTSAEALNCGLVNQVVERSALERTAADTVEQIIAAAPIAARYAKEAVAAAGDLPLAQGLRLEADLSIILQSTDDRARGLRSFAERRTPHFTGR